LSFLVGILVSLFTGQHDTESGYDGRMKQMHLGEPAGGPGRVDRQGRE
jgi:hypothetical protein